MLKQTPSLRTVAEFLAVGICIVTFALNSVGILAALMVPGAAGTRDFIEYWATAQQLVHHRNPYSTEEILKIERAVGYPPGIPAQMMPNPPSALLLVMPLGVVGPRAAELLWEMLLLASLVTSVKIVRSLYACPNNLLHLLAFSFAPVLSCLLAGQISLFILLGLSLFLRWHASRPFLAGASLWLCLLKPHLFLPFGVVLLLWILLIRRYKILAGASFALIVSSAIATAMDPMVWSQYRTMMSATRVDRLLMPCLGSVLRYYVSPHTFLLQCLPAIVGCVWAVVYFLKRRNTWDWKTHGSLLVLVSVFVVPYAWFMDEAILIPALLHGAYITSSRTLIAILALLSAVIQIGVLWGVPLHSAFYLWTAPAWLIWYLCAVRTTKKKHAGNPVEDKLPLARSKIARTEMLPDKQSLETRGAASC